MHALKLANAMLFLSTLSLRRATGVIDIINNIVNDFYPHSPCGERLCGKIKYFYSIPDFYPHSPCGERLYAIQDAHRWAPISIHTLLAESDSKSAQNSGALLRI